MNILNQKKKADFIKEALRVSKYLSVHWFPVGEIARKIDRLKLVFGWKHQAWIPDQKTIEEIVSGLNYTIIPYQTVREHLLLLGSIDKKLKNEEIYSVANTCQDMYGCILTIIK